MLVPWRDHIPISENVKPLPVLHPMELLARSIVS
jgi:hypothetical protein